MRVTTEDRSVLADPGSSPEFAVRVVNTGTIIDGVSARVIGAGAAVVRAEPAMLPLFPDAEGRIGVVLDLPETHPAGRHPLTVEVVSHTTGAVEFTDLELEVGARPSLDLHRHPRMVRGRRSGRFVLEIHNRGNVPLDVELDGAADAEGVTVRLNPDRVRVDPGVSTSVMAVVRGPRMITGSEIDRMAEVAVTARRAVALGAPVGDPARAEDRVEVEPETELAETTTLQLRQRPTIARGVLTFCVLACIVGLWAAAFLLGLTQVFSGDAATKSAPTSFFTNLDDAGAADDAAEASFAPGDDAQPPGTLPKDGLMPPGSGAEITGTVTAESDGAPVGRILVEAFRTDAEGELVQVSSGATQKDGTYSLAGLFPRAYQLKFSAQGFETAWYRPGGVARDGRRAAEVAVEAPSSTEGVDAVVTGLTGSISGTVDPGDVENPGAVVTRVEARQLGATGAPGEDGVAASDTTDATGAYQLTGLIAPGTYQLTFTTPGYRVTSITQRLDGGEARIQPTVLLDAGGGVISGHVKSGGEDLGGVTMSMVVDGAPVTMVTPTAGDTGAFLFQNLPTPGTYILTATDPSGASTTEFVRLDAGASRTDLDLTLQEGTGSITGTVQTVLPTGGRPVGLAGVTVTVGGAPTGEDGLPPSTVTLTNGADVGGFAINDLPVPGEYTLTFSKPGFESATLPVDLREDVAPKPITFLLTNQLGDVEGRVTALGGDILVGATVTATNGTDTVTGLSSGQGSELPGGGYVFRGLEPGWYSITVSHPSRVTLTSRVLVRPGGTASRDFELVPSGGS